jgi:hypothetical protein
VRCIREFGKCLIHILAKDTKIDTDLIYQHGIMGVK